MIHLKSKWKNFKYSLRKRGGIQRTLKLVSIVVQEKGVWGLIKHVLMLKNELKNQNKSIPWGSLIGKKPIIPSQLIYKNAYNLSLQQEPNPLISIIIINYNGQEHLNELLQSIKRQSYTNTEVLIVDNASVDDSIEFIQDNFPNYTLLKQKENSGFSKAVNLAAAQAKGRYFCLFNNDMVVDKNAVSQLYQCLRSDKEADEKIGAAGSKILFYQKFITIKVKSKKSVKILLDLNTLKTSLTIYPKILFTDYLLNLKLFNQAECHEFDSITEFKIPISYGQTRAKFRFYCQQNNTITIQSDDFIQTIECEAEQWTELHTDMLDSLKHAQWVINNAGSFIETDLSAGDRGFGLYDHKQFNQPEPVEALCGGALMFRPELLSDKPVFSAHFFAYYEDTDLSFRIRKAGYDVYYCPQSVVYHKHAATSNQQPIMFQHYNIRNRLLFIKLHYPEDVFLQHYKQKTKELQQHNPELVLELNEKLALIEKNIFY